MNKVTRAFKKLINRIPQPLPMGYAEFNTWSQSIIDTYEFPDNDSFRWSIAVIVQSLDQARAGVSKHYISLRVRKGAANQLAGQFMFDLKEKQKAEQQAAKEAAEAAAKAELESASESAKGPATPLE